MCEQPLCVPDSVINLQDIRRPLPPSAFLSVWRFQLPSGHTKSCPGNLISPEAQVIRRVSAGHIDTNPFLCSCFCEQHLSTSADVQTVKKDSSNEVEKIICEEKDNDHQVIKPSSVEMTTDMLFFLLHST